MADPSIHHVFAPLYDGSFRAVVAAAGTTKEASTLLSCGHGDDESEQNVTFVYGEEIRAIEHVLLRREVLGIERGLQLRRFTTGCSPGASRPSTHYRRYDVQGGTKKNVLACHIIKLKPSDSRWACARSFRRTTLKLR